MFKIIKFIASKLSKIKALQQELGGRKYSPVSLELSD
jgi:hypothetical protein